MYNAVIQNYFLNPKGKVIFGGVSGFSHFNPELICEITSLYECENWSLTLREDRRLRVFENRVLRIFGPKRDEVTREWSELHNEELVICIPLPLLFG